MNEGDMTKKRPTKAIIPAAGFGTRFLPQTKAMPKEMLPLIDKPIIQYVVEELVAAGIQDIIIVGNTNKRAIEDHFDLPNEDLLSVLRSGGPKKQPFIDQLEAISKLANFVYVRQKGPLGNAAPLLSAAHLISDDEPFIYKWADDFFRAEPNSTQQIIDTYLEHGGGVFACKAVESDSEYDKYGFAAGDEIGDGVLKMARIIEKPGKENAPSRLASVSNYLLPAGILPYVEAAAEVHDESVSEFTFQPFVQQMIEEGHPFFAREIKDGRFYDTGDKLEYLKAIVELGIDNKDFGDEFKRFIASRL